MRPHRLTETRKTSWWQSFRHDQIMRSAALALVTYAIGLVPFYLLTPIHDSVWNALYPAPPAVIVPASPTRSIALTPRVDAKTQVGADTVSVAAPTVESSQVSATVPVDATTDPRYAFVLLGYGGAGHDGAYLSDSIMLVIVDPDRKTLSLVSIPRDTWVPLIFGGGSVVYNKVNTAYAFARDSSLFTDRLSRYTGDHGGGVFATDTVSRLIGVPIRYYLGLDFSGFRQMIDSVGGVDVDVPASFSARYPANDDPTIDASWKVVRFVKGVQHMGGERAIEFARARETLDNLDEGTDFARSRRQRIIIEAFKSRLFQPGGLIHLPQLLGIGAGHVDTNYSVPDVASLSRLALDWKSVTIYQTAISTQNYLEEATGPEGTYTLVPDSPNHDWSQIQAFVKRLWKDPTAGVAMAQAHIVVENDTGVAGAAARVSSSLQNLGYVVLAPTTGTLRSDSRLLDGTGLHAGKTLGPLLQADLGIAQLSVDEVTDSATAGLTLELGSNDLEATKITVSAEAGAPISAVGIQKFGIWAPDSGNTDLAADTPTPSDLRKATGTATRAVSPVLTPTIGISGSETPNRQMTPPGGFPPSATPMPSSTPVLASQTPVPPPPTGSPTRIVGSPSPTPTRRSPPTPPASPTKPPAPQV